MKKDILDYIEDIIIATDQAIMFIEDMEYDSFVKDDKTNSAVMRKLEIIGEAVKNISANIKKKHTEIPWKDMAGMRDKLIHEYFGINLKRVWKTVKEDLPDLKEKIEKLRDIYEEK